MRVLLTGATGFIGRYVLQALQSHEIEVVAVGRTRPQAPVQFIEMDLLGITNFTELLQEARATHLLHLAWYAEHGKYWTSPLNLRWVEATTRLTEAFCAAGGQQVVMAGSCAEYDWRHGYCQEDSTPLNPATLYGTAKDATRRLVRAICDQYQVPCVWGRVFLPYGPGEDSRRLIPALLDVFEGNRAPFGVNAAAYRDFLHIEDVANSFITLLQNNASGSFNICSAQPVQISELVKLIAISKNADPNQVLSLSSDRPGEPSLLVGDNNKITALGWEARHEFKEIMTQGVSRK